MPHRALSKARHRRKARWSIGTSIRSTMHERVVGARKGPGMATPALRILPLDWSRPSRSQSIFLLLLAASFISPEKSRKMLPTPVGTNSGTSLLGPSLLDGNSRDSFVSRSLADVAEVSTQPCAWTGLPAHFWRLPDFSGRHVWLLRTACQDLNIRR